MFRSAILLCQQGSDDTCGANRTQRGQRNAIVSSRFRPDRVAHTTLWRGRHLFGATGMVSVEKASKATPSRYASQSIVRVTLSVLSSAGNIGRIVEFPMSL